MGQLDQAGTEAFEELFREHAGAVRAYGLRRTDPVEAQEVVSETFLVAWRRRDDIPADPLPWLLGVARRVLANRHRAVRRSEALHARLSTQPHPTEPDIGAAVDERAALLHILESMPEAERETLRLLAWESLAPAQAARVLDCSPATVAVRLHRARNRFRRAIRELEAGEESNPDRDRLNALTPSSEGADPTRR